MMRWHAGQPKQVVDEAEVACGQRRANVPKAEAVLNICFAGSGLPKADGVSP